MVQWWPVIVQGAQYRWCWWRDHAGPQCVSVSSSRSITGVRTRVTRAGVGLTSTISHQNQGQASTVQWTLPTLQLNFNLWINEIQNLWHIVLKGNFGDQKWESLIYCSFCFKVQNITIHCYLLILSCFNGRNLNPFTFLKSSWIILAQFRSQKYIQIVLSFSNKQQRWTKQNICW